MRAGELWSVLKKSFFDCLNDNTELLAAAISYFTVFSIVPIFILLTTLAGFFLESEVIQQELFRQIETIYSTRAAQSIQTLLDSSHDPKAGMASLFSGLLLLFLGSKVFVELQEALNIIWKVEKKGKKFRRVILKRLLSLVMFLSLGCFIFLFSVVGAALQFFSRTFSGFFPLLESTLFFELLSQGISVVLFSILFAIAYRTIPDRPVQWRDVWLGSIITAVLFGLGRYLFTLYFSQIDLTSTYGASGSIVVILVWVYFSSYIFLYGAKFTYVYSIKFGSLFSK